MLTNYVLNWFKRADEDLELIEIVLKEKPSSFNPVCFHAQQAAEKYLKGFLAHHDLHVRKVHDLEVLTEDCTKINKSFSVLLDSARFLSKFYVASRYPDEDRHFSINEAKEAHEAAEKIKSFVMDSIK